MTSALAWMRRRSQTLTIDGRAELLLAEWCTAMERREWREHGYITVRGSDKGLYRIHRKKHGTGRVERLQAGSRWAHWRRIDAQHRRRWYCIGIDYYSSVPLADEILALKLMIETNEQGFLRVANPYPASSFHRRSYHSSDDDWYEW